MPTSPASPRRAACLLAALICALPTLVLAAPSELEDEVVTELNYARTHPGYYARDLQDYRDRFTGRIAHETDGDLGVGTFEGPAAVDEAIAVVGRLKPAPAVVYDPALARAAADHADDQSRTGGVGHAGSDGSTLGQRVWRYAKGRMLVGEIISYGQPTPERVIRQLVVDDGERSRLHRADVFLPAFKRVGVACRHHPVYQFVCVIDLSG